MKANNEKVILYLLSRLMNRVNIHITINYVSISLFAGLCVSVILIISSKFIFIRFISAIFIIIALSIIIGFVIGIMKRISLPKSARLIDNKLSLEDRFSSAIDIINGNIKHTALSELQLEDTANYANKIDLKLVYPNIIPKITKLLPIFIIALVLAFFMPIQYGESIDIRQAINHVGKNIEISAKQVEKQNLSEKAEKMILEAEKIGRDLQDKNITKKIALQKISDLSNRVEIMREISELSERLRDDITPDKRLLINELMQKLSDNLRDFTEMGDLLQKISDAQRSNLSDEAIKELIKALDEKRLAPTDIKTLQQISSQLASGKQEITQKITTAFRTRSASGKGENINQEGDTGKGEGSPDDKSIKLSDADPSKRITRTDQGQKAELNGKISSDGRIANISSEQTPNKGVSVVPYEEIYFEYRESADNAIAKSTIPRAYKEQVKRYFDTIKPQGK